MLWEEYYDKVWDWAVSTSVRKLSQVETFGPADEIIEVFQHIAFDDEKAAVRLIKKALAAGVKFSGDQIAELCLICDEAIIEQAVTQSSDTFTTEDLDALYGVCDEEILLEIAGKRKVPLPESLAEF